MRYRLGFDASTDELASQHRLALAALVLVVIRRIMRAAEGRCIPALRD